MLFRSNNYGSYDVMLIACNALACDTLLLTGFINEFQNPSDSIWQIGNVLYSLHSENYQWYEVSSGIIPGAVDSFYVITQPGSYYCVIADSIGCIATSNIITVTGLDQLTANNAMGIEILQNGLYNCYCTNCANGLIQLTLTDAGSRCVYKNDQQQFNVPFTMNLRPGLYIVSMQSANISLTQKLLIINKN